MREGKYVELGEEDSIGSSWCECSNLLTLAEIVRVPGVADNTELIKQSSRKSTDNEEL